MTTLKACALHRSGLSVGATRSPASPSAPRSVLCGHLHAGTAGTVKVQARDKSQARETVASNPGCASAVLAGLAAGFDLADRGVRLALARNPGCDSAVLAVFAADPDERVCAAVAGHPGCAPTVLAFLAGDPDPAVRLRAADNPNCATAVLGGLAADAQHWGVRSAAAANPNIAAAVLVELAVADVHVVRAAAASNPLCGAEMLQRLADDENTRPRESVARNPACSAQLLRQLARDDEKFVRIAAATNPICPRDAVEALSRDPLADVREAVARPRGPTQLCCNTSLATATTMCSRQWQPTRPALLRRCSNSPETTPPVCEPQRPATRAAGRRLLLALRADPHKDVRSRALEALRQRV